MMLCFISQAQQNSSHTSVVANASFNIPVNTNVKAFNSGEAETYMVVSDSNEFEYTLTINKFPNAELSFEDIKGGEFKRNYLTTCSCEILEEKEQFYGQLKTYQYVSTMVSNGNKLYGLVDFIENKGGVYAFIYLTTKDNYEKFKSSYREVLESLDFKE